MVAEQMKRRRVFSILDRIAAARDHVERRTWSADLRDEVADTAG